MEGRRTHRRWQDYSRRQRTAVVGLAVVEVALASAAWRDLARRPDEEIRGPKWGWALVIAVNIVGPLCYFRFGRVGVPRAAGA